MVCDTILVVDDVEVNRELLQLILMEDYRVIFAADGAEAMRQLEKERSRIAAVLLDLIMPEMDGYEVLRKMNRLGYIMDIPVLVISSEESVGSQKECFTQGVSDFIHKPFDRDLVRTRVNNVVNLYLYKHHLEETVDEQTKVIKKRNTNILELMGTVIESRSLESGTHVQRVKEYTRILAEELMKRYPKYGLTPHKVSVIAEASTLHDIGKIAIPDSILLKPGRFTPEEFEEMKKHTTLGSELLKNVHDMWDEEYGDVTYDICRHHHEKYDGKGYPDGLAGEEIPISAQLVSVADCYDALVSKRCYKDAFSLDTAYKMLMDGDCGEFSKELKECLSAVIDKFEAVAISKSE